MHINHKPAEQVEVDRAGDTAELIDLYTGEIVPAYIFVGVMTYSQYAYVEAFPDEKQQSWIDAHVHMYEYFLCRITGTVIEVFYNQNRIASHRRLYGRKNQYSTVTELCRRIISTILNGTAILQSLYGKSSTIFCSQYSRDGWYEQFGGAASPLADAILDRIIHDAYMINIVPVIHQRILLMTSYFVSDLLRLIVRDLLLLMSVPSIV